MINPNRLCPNCLSELKDGTQYCAKCGKRIEAYESNPRYLPPYTILGGKYLIGKALGAGGFGITYLALDLNLNMKLAIKEYFPSELATRDTTGGTITELTVRQGKSSEYFQKGLNQFMNEAKNLARFNQLPGIVSVKDVFFENHTAYMVTEYIDGITLKEKMNQTGKSFTWEDTLGMLEPVIKTLIRVHMGGIIHRDISPDNIMITMDGQIKLIDFGAARVVDPNNPKSLTIMLKFGYAPEEQYRSNGRQGPWTDVYALSATMYKMITGQVPEESVKRLVDGTNVPSVQAYSPDMPREAAAAIMRGLSVAAENRQQSMTELYDELYMGKQAPARVQPAPAPIQEKQDRMMQVTQATSDHGGNQSAIWLVLGGIAVLFVIIMAVALSSSGKRVNTKEESNTAAQTTPQTMIEVTEAPTVTATMEPTIEAEPTLPMVTEISENESIAMYNAANSIPIVNSVYDDFDGDGVRELFIYASTEGEYADYNCQIWFVNEDGARQVGTTEDNWGYYVEQDAPLVVQFGNTKHFSVTKSGIVAAQGWQTTTFAYEDKIPHVVLQDFATRLLCKNGETFVRVAQQQPYDSMASGRDYQSYQIYYEGGSYHLYQFKESSYEEFLNYDNGKEAYAEAVKNLQNLVVQSDMWGDFNLSEYPYMIAYQVLSYENGKIYINFEQWRNETESQAIYLDELFLEDTPCYLTYAVFQVNGNSVTFLEADMGYIDSEFQPTF
ncbi:MAG: serine/threonine-protein kinase [bacterium]|nr:serine/threonine-protein kinase [bacterium]